MWQKNRFVSMLPAGGPSEVDATQLACAPDGGLWVCTPRQLLKLREGRWVAQLQWEPPAFAAEGARALYTDRQGNLWLCEPGQGIWHATESGELALLTAHDGLPNAQIDAWLEDREGNIWLGTPSGLVRIRPKIFHSIGAGTNELRGFPRSICEDLDGTIWIGTDEGLERWRDSRCEPVFVPGLLQSLNSTLVSPGTAPGDLWVATAGNGAMLLSRTNAQHPFPALSVGTAIRVVHTDRQGGIWFGGSYGLFRWNGESLKKYGLDEGLPAGRIFDISQAADGQIWVALDSRRLASIREERVTVHRLEEARPEARFRALLASDDGTVWIGTLGRGLLRFREGTAFNYTRAHGLPSEFVTQLLEDDQGGLWGGTQNGIFRVAKKALHEVASGQTSAAAFSLYGRDDGLPSVECSGGLQPACWRARNGQLWFTTVKGAVWVHPASVKPNLIPPPVVIEEMRVDGKAIPFPVDKGRDFELQIPPGRHHFEFRFTALSFVSSTKVRFQWHVKGVDDGWVEGGTARSVSYSALSPGKYKFAVRACNNDGIWNLEGSALAFEVRPHLWQRRSAQYGAIALLVAAAVLVVVLVLRSRHHRQLQRLEARRALEEERARIAQDLHDDLGAGLTQINLASAMARNRSMSSEVVSELLCDIGIRAHNLVTALDEIVWAINPRNDTLSSVATYFSQFAQDFLKTTPIACRLNISNHLPALPLDPEQRHSLFLAFQEAIHNVVQHSGASEMELEINVCEKVISICVRDNGHGLAADPTAEGADGLKNMRERLRRLGGMCNITSSPNQGTSVTFSLSLPSKRV
ncbi:MAG: two-component regulator propeller domain-containing protein [Verrucomicrobiota bacterium]